MDWRGKLRARLKEKKERSLTPENGFGMTAKIIERVPTTAKPCLIAGGQSQLGFDTVSALHIIERQAAAMGFRDLAAEDQADA